MTSPRVVGVNDAQISPDGKSIAVVISRANLDENRLRTCGGGA
jgi:hypothetical protein